MSQSGNSRGGLFGGWFKGSGGGGGLTGKGEGPPPVTQDRKKDAKDNKNEEDVDETVTLKKKDYLKTKVGHGFDPTALERGAKAIKEIDSSPNSKAALELAVEQERTQQLKAKERIEQNKAAAATAEERRLRAEYEEKRKYLERQQELDRQNAQHKAKLQRELAQQKLENENKAHADRLKQQHDQFLLQQKLARENEQRMQEERRRTLEKEAELQRQNELKRTEAEVAGRIRQERENEDVQTRIWKVRSEEDRKTQLEVVKERFAHFSRFGTAVKEVLVDREKMSVVVGSLTLLALGVYSAKVGTNVAGQYVLSKLGKPNLVRETSRINFSRLSPSGFASSVTSTLAKLTKPKKSPTDTLLEGMVFNDELTRRLSWIATSTLNTKRHKAPFRHILLHGPPGTGKTLFSKQLATASGLDYAIMTGGDFGPLGKDAVTQLHKVFDWAETSRKGTILFIDEADAFLQKRRPGMSEDMRNCLSAFLYRSGTESSKFMIVMASNLPHTMDSAVLDRVDDTVEFTLPGEKEREHLLKLYFEKYITNAQAGKADAIKVEGFTESTFAQLAKKTEGYSGRQLTKFIISLQSAVYGGFETVLTPALAESVLQFRRDPGSEFAAAIKAANAIKNE